MQLTIRFIILHCMGPEVNFPNAQKKGLELPSPQTRVSVALRSLCGHHVPTKEAVVTKTLNQ